jgi:hypothetical protein
MKLLVLALVTILLSRARFSLVVRLGLALRSRYARASCKRLFIGEEKIVAAALKVQATSATACGSEELASRGLFVERK